MNNNEISEISEISEINKLCGLLNKLELDTYWVDYLSKYLMKMSDLSDPSLIDTIMCIEPQSYESINKLRQDMVE